MIILDDLKRAFEATVDPGKKANKEMDVGGYLFMYYRTMIIPLILVLVFSVIASFLFVNIILSAVVHIVCAQRANGCPNAATATNALSGLRLFMIIIGSIADYVVIIPIGIFIYSAILHLVGTGLGTFKKGTFNKTFGAVTYGIMPGLIFAWLPFINTLAQLWGIVVLIIAMANLHKAKRSDAFVVWIAGMLIMIAVAVVVLMFIMAVILPLIISGIANGTLPANTAGTTL